MPILDPRLVHGMHLRRMRRAGAVREGARADTAFQTSTIAALMDGAYEGDLSIGELARHGDFGIGTVDRLDGEMIAVGGEFFVARADGVVARLPPETRTPFAVDVPWRADATAAREPASSFDALQAQLDRAIGPADDIVAVRVDGRFSRVRARSVPKQNPPYPPLAEVAKHQVVFDWTDLEGTLVGFRSPATAEGYEVVGYHLHVLSSDRRRGGHLLDCALIEGLAQVHRATHVHVEIPRGLAWNPPHGDAPALRRIER